MTTCFHLPTSRESAETVSSVIEIPTGTRKKFKLLSRRTFFRLGSSLNSPVRYPRRHTCPRSRARASGLCLSSTRHVCDVGAGQL